MRERERPRAATREGIRPASRTVAGMGDGDDASACEPAKQVRNFRFSPHLLLIYFSFSSELKNGPRGL